jgi:nucleoid-associated protein EbfC
VAEGAGGDVVGGGTGRVASAVAETDGEVGDEAGADGDGAEEGAEVAAVTGGAATGDDGSATGAAEPHPASSRTSPAAPTTRVTAGTATACQFPERRARRIGSGQHNRPTPEHRRPAVRPGGQPNMQQLMKQAQKMQQELLAAQEELAQTEVTGSAGGGLVTATVSGSNELKSVVIDPSVVDPDDVETLQDLVVAAIRDANRAAQDLAGQRMGPLTQGMGGLGLGM